MIENKKTQLRIIDEQLLTNHWQTETLKAQAKILEMNKKNLDLHKAALEKEIKELESVSDEGVGDE